MTDHIDNRPLYVPISSYRLQFHRGFRFIDAVGLAPYLSKLGISDVYSSPYLTARPGSTHGYDICDHGSLNQELGGDTEYETLVRALAEQNIGQLLDFVPNHMGNDPGTNPWWRDVLENGPSSPYARYFDIDWEPLKEELHDKVLLPILGDQYGSVLERGELQLRFEQGSFDLSHGDSRLPINPRESARLLRHGLEALRASLPEDDPSMRELLSIISELQNLPPYTDTDPDRIAERQREKEVARDRLTKLVGASPAIEQHIRDAVSAFNGKLGDPESFSPLHDLLEAQPYRLSYWRTASHEINYRRFFDINELAGLRMESPDVFAATHRLVRRLIAERKVTGLRINHPDGLYDPAEYFERLQEMARKEWRDTAGAPFNPIRRPRPLYIVVEKILSVHESLPPDWLVHGTTGYNFLNDLNGLFIATDNARRLRKIYERFTSRKDSFDEVVYESKKLIMETAMASELNLLAHALNRISEGNRRSRDFTLNSLRDVLTEIVACFPVYRTYVRSTGWTMADRETVEIAVLRARRRSPATEPTIFDFVREVLLPRRPESVETSGSERRDGYAALTAEEYNRRLHFAMKFQQYTAPVQAKGVEDTAFYRYNLLLSLNEVGGDPARMGRTVTAFHETNRKRRESWPGEMLATATHDSKLGEDVRARLNALSELPDEWRREVSAWARLNASNRTLVDAVQAPDRNDEYRFYQVLVGAWPFTDGTSTPPDFIARIRDYMMKSIREAKIHTSWINQYKPYDDAMSSFVERTLGGPNAGRFLARFLPFQRRIAQLGMINSLAQLVLKIASPGTADFYQGAELWMLSLVDPDNRQPVDFARRSPMLDELAPLLPDQPGATIDSESLLASVSGMLTEWTSGRIKLFVTAAGLRFRRCHRTLVLEGGYLPLETDLTVPAGAVAFARHLGDEVLIAIAPRLVSQVTSVDQPLPIGADCWKTSRVLLPADLPRTAYRHVLTGEIVHPFGHNGESWLFIGDALRTAPVALLANA